MARSGQKTLCWVASSRGLGSVGQLALVTAVPSLACSRPQLGERRPTTTELHGADWSSVGWLPRPRHERPTGWDLHGRSHCSATVAAQPDNRGRSRNDAKTFRFLHFPTPNRPTARLRDRSEIFRRRGETPLMCNFHAYGVNCVRQISAADFQTNWITCRSKPRLNMRSAYSSNLQTDDAQRTWLFVVDSSFTPTTPEK